MRLRVAATTLAAAAAVAIAATGVLVGAPAFAAPGPDVPSLVANPSSGPPTSTIAVTAHFPYADCPIKGAPKVAFMWDSLTLASVGMNGRCDVATTIAVPSGAAGGVHRLDATVLDSDGKTLTASGLFTIDGATATLSPSPTPSLPPAGTRSKSSRYALFTLLVAALIGVALLRWRRSTRRRP
jgi:hypothetical protein